jgi:hypothetical protein
MVNKDDISPTSSLDRIESSITHHRTNTELLCGESLAL